MREAEERSEPPQDGLNVMAHPMTVDKDVCGTVTSFKVALKVAAEAIAPPCTPPHESSVPAYTPRWPPRGVLFGQDLGALSARMGVERAEHRRALVHLFHGHLLLMRLDGHAPLGANVPGAE